MATCTHAVTTPDTGATPNTSGAFTPAVDDLLVVFVVGSGTSGAGNLTSSIGGFTFTQVRQASWSTTGMLWVFVADALVSSATSQTVTTTPADATTGTVISVWRVSGVTRTGLSAIKQHAGGNGADTTTPTFTFSTAVQTGNPTIIGMGNLSNPAGMTAPTNWTEPAGADTGYATPTTGGEFASRDSGFTGTTVTWGNTSTAWGAAGVEIDTSAPPLENAAQPHQDLGAEFGPHISQRLGGMLQAA